MQIKNNTDRYGAIAITFHWAMALLIIGLLALGLYMADLDPDPFTFKLYMLHKSFGTLVFMLAVLRVLWLFSNKKPAPLPSHKPWEIKLAHITHILLYVLIILMPLSGWLMNGAGAFPHPFFGFFTIPPLIGKDESIFRLMREVHEICGFGLMAIIGLHVAGALKHLIIDKDLTIQRIWPERPVIFFGAIVLFCVALIYINGIERPATAPMNSAATAQNAEQLPKENIGAHVQQSAASTTPLPALSWAIIPEESSIEFEATVEGTPFQGVFNNIAGAILFDPENLAQSRADITIDMASVHSGSTERDEYMVAPLWFGAESFPESRFVTTKFEKTNENQYVAHGDLTIKGVSVPVDLLFTLNITNDENGNNLAKMRGETMIRRLDYNVGEGDWRDTENVANEVLIRVFIEAFRE